MQNSQIFILLFNRNLNYYNKFKEGPEQHFFYVRCVFVELQSRKKKEYLELSFAERNILLLKEGHYKKNIL